MRPTASVWDSDCTSNCHHLESVLPSASRANYCQSPAPGIRLLPWREVSLVWLCHKASPSWQRAPSSSQQFLPTAPWPVWVAYYTAAASLSPFCLFPRFNFPTLLLEENFKRGSIDQSSQAGLFFFFKVY